MSDRIYTMECHSAIKKKELVIHATTWFNLQGLALSKKKSQYQKLHTIRIQLYNTSEGTKF